MLMLTLITRLKQCLSGFSSIKRLFLLPILVSLEGSCYAQPTLREWGVLLHLLETRKSASVTWNYSAWEIYLFSSIHLVIQSFIYTSMDLWIFFYTFGFNPILLHLIVQMDRALAIGSAFDWFFCPFDMLPHPNIMA